MIPEGNRKENIDRFLGFQDTYDRFRPEAPPLVAELLSQYLGGRPALVADVGCGTGLSTLIWSRAADTVYGVEPNPDMLGKALEKLSGLPAGSSTVTFVQGYSNSLPFAAGSLDIITCSQSFHWMEPGSTLQEFARCLREGGVFAAYDCDWPPVVHPQVEAAYNRLVGLADRLLQSLQPEEEQASKWSKEGHLSQIRESGHFSYAREIVFHHTESCDADRFTGLALSQGGLQTVLKLAPDLLEQEIAEFAGLVESHFAGRTLPMLLGYRMRLGIK
ncbi:class I SAM-dependent methyltransferase [Paenibacillus tengchongensis]|uniref:class I SAM-dependent methyltransferase n=1 Tax=Paenibacillus tengchongensis TaxID=2608684 RepID=UPI00124CFDF4|nr:class I SAM-dependent methyltransferase [Paenibacillus tengchongensis]